MGAVEYPSPVFERSFIRENSVEPTLVPELGPSLDLEVVLLPHPPPTGPTPDEQVLGVVVAGVELLAFQQVVGSRDGRNAIVMTVAIQHLGRELEERGLRDTVVLKNNALFL